jgi:hypothetical protein
VIDAPVVFQEPVAVGVLILIASGAAERGRVSSIRKAEAARRIRMLSNLGI